MQVEGPGQYVEHTPAGPHPIVGVETAVAAFVGTAPRGPIGQAVRVLSFAEFERSFGTGSGTLPGALRDFTLNGGRDAWVVRVSDFGDVADVGLAALDAASGFSVLVVPGSSATDPVFVSAAAYCERRRALLVSDAPDLPLEDLAIATVSPNAAVYYPRLRRPHPETGDLETRGAAASVAGVIARTDSMRGVWKAPAGQDATLVGSSGMARKLVDVDAASLTAVGINCLRVLPGAGAVVWGARTTAGADGSTSPWRYVPVRRTALFIEESIERGTAWTVFEANDEKLWRAVEESVEQFLLALFSQGAFAGATPTQSFSVNCRGEGDQLRIEVGIAMLKPSEFVLLLIQRTISA